MDINHHIFLLLLSGELHAAPLSSSPGRVLDLGAGTGLWAIDMGDKYPSASITGNDLSPIQPRVVPPNVQFEIDDFTADWTYSPGSFDFIHARGMFGSVSDYPKLYAQVMKALKPGGYFEQTEIDISVGSEDGSTKGTPFEQWSPLLEESSHKFSKPMRVINDVYPNMVKAGFEDVKEKRFKMPIGGWAKDKHMKELGRYNGAAWDQGCDGWIMFLFTKFLEVSHPPSDVEQLATKVGFGLILFCSGDRKKSLFSVPSFVKHCEIVMYMHTRKCPCFHPPYRNVNC